MVAPHFDPALVRAKAVMRKAARARRAGCDPALGHALAQHLLLDMPPPAGAVVAGYWPIGDEIDIRPLLTILHARGHPVLLPETPPRGQPLIFRHWLPGMTMRVEPFGTKCPTGEPATPDWLLVPLLAFDRTGRRLGYGGGYYDRSLALLPGAVAIGCAYARQEVPEVPADEQDIRLHAVATEAGVIRVMA